MLHIYDKRRIKFYIVTNIGDNFDIDHAVQILKNDVSRWLEIDISDVSYLWSELAKSYKVNYPDKLVMVEDVQLGQKEAEITIKLAKEAIEKGRLREAERKAKRQLAKDQKKAQSIAEKKALFEQLKKEFES